MALRLSGEHWGAIAEVLRAVTRVDARQRVAIANFIFRALAA